MAKILVIDDEISDREAMRRGLSQKGYEVMSVTSAGHAMTAVSEEAFDLILSDVNLIGDSGLNILKRIKELQKKIPIVMYSGALTPEIEKEARIAGAHDVLDKGIGPQQLVMQLERIIEARDHIFEDTPKSKEKSILVVDDEEPIRKDLLGFFETKGYQVFEAESGEAALQSVRQATCPVVLLDINMPGMDGLTTLSKLLEIDPKLGVVMLTESYDHENVQKALDLGAYGYVLKPFDLLYLELVVMSKLTIVEGK